MPEEGTGGKPGTGTRVAHPCAGQADAVDGVCALAAVRGHRLFHLAGGEQQQAEGECLLQQECMLYIFLHIHNACFWG
ncbi:MAG: hypothetical protein LUE99_15055 [Bacteroides sp.]|nr:hypothetical protein [Bacteroides sp.]